MKYKIQYYLNVAGMTIKGNDSNHLKVIPSGITATIKEYMYLLYMIVATVLAIQ